MTIAHAGLGLFVMGACFEGAFKLEASQELAIGGHMRLGGYALSLDRVGGVDGPNYDAERGVVSITSNGAAVCTAAPERRFYPAGAQTTSQVAICQRGLDDLYVVLGEPARGSAAWVVRAYFNPWARLIFFGPIIIALGGLISLSDRRLRFALPRRARTAIALEPAE